MIASRKARADRPRNPAYRPARVIFGARAPKTTRRVAFMSGKTRARFPPSPSAPGDSFFQAF